MRFLALACLVFACIGASYYVSPTGDDGQNGSIGTPWLTIQHGLNTVAAGDTLNVLSGDYYSTNHTVSDGTQGSPIVLQGYPGTWIKHTNGNSASVGFVLANAWNVVRGFQMYSNYMVISNLTATHNIVESNWVERSKAISFTGAPLPYTNGPSFNEVRFNTFTNMAYNIAAMGIEGFNNTVESNLWIVSNDNDAIDFFGWSNVIRGNLMVDVGPSSEHTGNHVDMFQTFGQAGQEAHWITIENNVISNSAGHFFIAQPYTNTPESTTDMVIRNNVIIGGGGDSFCYAPRVQFLNNTFYGNTSGVPSIWIRGGDPYGWPTNCVVLNNIVAESTANAPLAVDSSITNVTVCGYNFVSKSGGAAPPEPYGISNILGGYVGFVSTNPAAWNLRLLSTSACVNTGTNISALVPQDILGNQRDTTWDMGAYDYLGRILRSGIFRGGVLKGK